MYAPERTRGVLHLVGRSRHTLSIEDSSVRIALRGDLDSQSSPSLRLHLLSLVCDDGPIEIVVDLSRVTWLDAAGIRPLVEAQRLQQARGAVMRLVQPSVQVQRYVASEPAAAGLLIAFEPAAITCTPEPPRFSASCPDTKTATSGISSQERAQHSSLLDEIAQLKEALATRDVIGQAKGVISLLYGLDEACAFESLKQTSQDTNRKLRDIAVLIAVSAARGTPIPAEIASRLRYAALRNQLLPFPAE